MSPKSKDVKSLFISPDLFIECYEELVDIEQKSLISHVIINNLPFVFKDIPLLYEQILQYLSSTLNIEPECIKLIGSAKTGFSVSPHPDFGKPFSSKSDLDFAIIHEDIFKRLKEEYVVWKNAYTSEKIKPNNAREMMFWNENIKRLSANINRGFLDTYKIPNRSLCPLTKCINNSMSLIKTRLAQYHSITVSNVSVRVYKDSTCFWRQLKLNTDQILRGK